MPHCEAQYSDLPETYAFPSETLEVVRKSEDKEIAPGREDYAPEPYLDPSSVEDESTSQPTHPQITRKRLFLCVALVLTTLALALGLGLGLGLGNNSADDKTGTSSAGNGQNTHQTNLTAHGVLNGTNTISTQDIYFDPDGTLHIQGDRDHLLLFYQHASGDIRWMQKSGVNSWYGGTRDETIISDAKFGTPLSYLLNSGPEFHFFYIDRNNTLRQSYCFSSSSDWYSGPLDDLDYATLEGPGTAFKMGRYTGPIANTDLSTIDTSECVRLFVGITETTIGQLVWCPGIDWQVENTWTSVNGRSSPAFLGYLAGSTTYAAFTDLDNNGQLYWEDTAEGAANTAEHPINQWTVVPAVTIPNIDPSGGLSALTASGTLIGRTLDSGTIQNWNITLAAENSRAVPAWTLDKPQTMPGSQIEAFITPLEDPVAMRLIYQTTDGDITMSIRNLDSGTWETTVWPIPND